MTVIGLRNPYYENHSFLSLTFVLVLFNNISFMIEFCKIVRRVVNLWIYISLRSEYVFFFGLFERTAIEGVR